MRIEWDKRRRKKFWNYCGIYYINMLGISRKTYKRNLLEEIVDSNGILLLNERHIEEGLGHMHVMHDYSKVSFLQ